MKNFQIIALLVCMFTAAQQLKAGEPSLQPNKTGQVVFLNEAIRTYMLLRPIRETNMPTIKYKLGNMTNPTSLFVHKAKSSAISNVLAWDGRLVFKLNKNMLLKLSYN